MGKEVFAVPGRVDDPRSRGCHALIQDGAKLVEDVEDIIEEFGPLAEVLKPPAEVPEAAAPKGLTGEQRRVFDAVERSPRTVDEIARHAGLDVAPTLAALLTLEIRGLVRQLPGKRFVRRGL